MKSLEAIRRGETLAFPSISMRSSRIQEDAENSPAHVASPGDSILSVAMHNMYHISTLASDLYQIMSDTDHVNPNDVDDIQKAYDILSAMHDRSNRTQEDEGIQNYP